MKSILFTNHSSSLNLGDAALLSSPISMIRNKKGDYYKIKVMTSDPHYVNITNVDVIFDPIHIPLYYRTYKNLNFINHLNINKVIRAYLDADKIIIRGGDGFSSIYGNTSLLVRVIENYPSIMLKKEVMFLGHTFSPLYGKGIISKIAINNLLKQLNHSKYITVREQASRDQLINLGVDSNKIYVLPDVAFWLQYYDSNKIRKKIQDTFGNENTIIGIMNSYSLFNIFKNNNQDYIKFVSKIIKKIKQITGSNIILLPHSYIPKKDDRYIHNKIVNKLLNVSNIISIDEQLTPEIAKTYIGALDFLLSFGRLHPLIHAISQNIPCMGIDYSHRIEGLFSAINMKRLAYNMHDFNYELFIKEFKFNWESRDQIKTNIKQAQPLIEKGKKITMDLMTNFLED